MKQIDRLDWLSFCNGLVFFAPVALLVRTQAGVPLPWFFLLQAALSLTILIFELPAGLLTDRIGYRRTLLLAQLTAFAARLLLLAAFLCRSLPLFFLEAAVEGVSSCFLSGTLEAYLYHACGPERYPARMARAANFGTAGFLLSTLCYAALYRLGGIPLLLAATALACGAGIPCALGLSPEPEIAGPESKPASPLSLLREGKLALFVLLAAGFSLAFLLINFFYAEKLQALGLDAAWLSPIIVGYSLIQMLAERILAKTRPAHRRPLLLGGVLLAAGLMALFAVSDAGAVVLPTMLLLPLALTVPDFLLGSLENRQIDRLGQGENRATILSAMSMGGNLLEVVFLFASAALSGAGASACFLAAAGLLALFGCAVALAADK